MDRQPDLQTLLESLADDPDNVYFQPPNNVVIKYPAIVYHRDYGNTLFAGNLPYRVTRRYQVTVIDRDPNSVVLGKIANLPLCTYLRYFAVDGLNHDVYTLYF